jgi:hypothetical protein
MGVDDPSIQLDPSPATEGLDSAKPLKYKRPVPKSRRALMA